MSATCQPLEPRRLLDGVMPSQPVSAVTIDLLAVYTPGAKAQFGGSDAAIATAIQRAVDTMNNAMDNSAIAVSVRLVRSEQIAYVGSGDVYIDRTRLENPGDGFMDSAHALRNTWGADVVAVIVESGFGGNANLMTSTTNPNNSSLAFTAIAWDAIAAENLTLAHEIGHILGAGHERNNPTQPAVGPFSYSYGYRFTSNSVVYHDIMSYDPGIGLPYFANPAVSYQGAPTGSTIGNADEADLAKTFEVTSPIVAAYRSSVVADTTGPTAGVRAIQRNGSLLTFTIRYTDDSGIDLSTIDSNDITVTVPDGFILSAGLVSVRHPGVGGGVKEATYRVRLPDNLPPTDSLVFSMKSSAIKDKFGNSASAGLITPYLPHNQNSGLASAMDFGLLEEEVTTGATLGYADHEQIFRFTLNSPQTVSVKMSNLLANANIFLVRDLNNNSVFDGGAEEGQGSFNAGTSDESFTVNLAAGTYYLWAYNFTANTDNRFLLQVSRYTDAAPPVAMLDAKDITTAGNTDFLFRVGYQDNREMDAITTRYYSPIRLTNPFGGYYVYFAESVDSDVNRKMIWATYRVSYNGGGAITAGDNGIYTIAIEPQNSSIWGANPLNDFVHDAAGNKLVPATLGTFRVGVGSPDTTAPTAAVSAGNIVVGNTAAYDFTVTYRDNVGVNESTLDNSDLRITGPNGFNQLATKISVSPAIAASGERKVVYRITAPGGLWDFTDNGSYSVAMEPSQVKDAANNSVASGTLASFNVHIFMPGDATQDNKVNAIDFNLLAGNFALRGRGFSEADFNYDGAVDSTDFNLLTANFGKVIPASAEPLFGAFPLAESLDLEV